MNLYKHHSNPENLKHRDVAYEKVPNLIWEKYKNSPEIKNYEDILAEDPNTSYKYAYRVIEGRFPEGEKVIATNARYSYLYALNVIRDRFSEGEKAIASNAKLAYHYASVIVKGRFPEGEKAIASNDTWLLLYTSNVIGVEKLGAMLDNAN